MNPFTARPEELSNTAQRERSILSLRRRGTWEASDSGVLLWRSSFAWFLPFFAIPFWTVACSLRLLPGNLVFFSYLILWWLKPLFDRPVLYVVSRNLFGSTVPFSFADLGSLRRGILGDLLWRRFSPGRAATMPIRVLENLNSKQFAQRKKVLGAGGLGFCSFLGVLGFALELMLLFGELIFFSVIFQIFFPSVNIMNSLRAVEVFVFVLFCFNYILVESLYVCMGFGLYINSRVELEGWDLQLIFQNFAKLGFNKPGIDKPDLKAILIVCIFLSLLAAPSAAFANEVFPEAFPTVSVESLDELKEILASPDFGSERESWEIRLRNQREPAEIPEIEAAPWMESIRLIFSFMLRLLVILAIAGFLGFAFYWSWKNRELFQRRNKALDVRKTYTDPHLLSESPETHFSKAEDLFSEGLFREAWAACLAGCLGAFTRKSPISFPVDATEYDCLNLVRHVLPDEGAGFGELVQSWVLFAYGERRPADGAFEQALAYGRSLLETGAVHE